MFFWKTTETVKYSKKTSLQASQKHIYPNMNAGLLNPKLKKSKRTFSFPPSAVRASVCVEASLSFSFFMFFFINIFSIIFAFVAYTEDFTTLQQQAKEIASYAYVTKSMWEENEDLIELKKERKIKSVFSILPVPDYKLMAKCVVKPWVGYQVIKRKTRDEEETLVYITEYGSVYHKKRDCTHLSLSVSITSMSAVIKEKNKDGEFYESCEFCGKNGFASAVYITAYGDKYHTSVNCRGLKRIVKSVPLSEVSGKRVCKKCG